MAIASGYSFKLDTTYYSFVAIILLTLIASTRSFPRQGLIYSNSPDMFQIESPIVYDSEYEENLVNDQPGDYKIIPWLNTVHERSSYPDVQGQVIDTSSEENNQDDFPLGIPEEEKNVPGEPLTPQDFENAKNLELLLPPQDENSPDPLEVAGLFEGDIAGVNASDLVQERNAIRNLHSRWPRGIVPYVISASFSMYERSVIAAAFLDYHASTCMRFVPRTTQLDYVYLMKGAGCSSQVGRSGAGQQISLGPGCLYKGIVVHELMHAVGFWHEQSRGDRDEHIAVLWQNIQRGMEHNFQKYSWKVMQTLGLPYDISSVMHYGMYAFSRDHRSPTIVPRKSGTQLLGQRQGFSKIDMMKLNALYECNGGNIVSPTLPPPVKPVKPNICSDNNRLCQYWSRIGECQKNPAWMLVNCANSCKQCGSKCTNYNTLCTRWSELGECIKNPDYMAIYCPKACHACYADTPGTEDCLDRNKYCTAWVKSGQCRANPSYMLQFCRKSCNQC